MRVINILRNLATKNRHTIICTIHQPRASILPMFDKLLLLADGGVTYYGPTWTHGKEDGLLAYLRSAGYVTDSTSRVALLPVAPWLTHRGVVHCVSSSSPFPAFLARRLRIQLTTSWTSSTLCLTCPSYEVYVAGRGCLPAVFRLLRDTAEPHTTPAA